MTDHLNDIFEVFARCRNCWKPSVGELRAKSSHKVPGEYNGNYLNPDYELRGWVTVIPNARKCPDFVPVEIVRIFDEAARAEAIGLWDAAGTMFRKVLDAATRS